MFNILILCQQKELVETIKKQISKCVGCNVFIHQEWKLDQLEQSRTRYLFIIVDIDQFGIIDNYFKMQDRWRNSYYIYLSQGYQLSYQAIGYNVLGYLTYDKLTSLEEKFNQYMQLVAKTYQCYFKTEDGFEIFKFYEIIYFEIKNRKVKLENIHGEFYLVNYKLKDIMQILDSRFYYINKSVIINIDYIKKITMENTLILHYATITKEFKLSKKAYNHLELNKKSGSIDIIRQI